MTLERIEAAINAVCSEIYSQMSEVTRWFERTEVELYRELIACILGSQVSFEMALAATDALDENGLLNYCGDQESYFLQVERTLQKPLSRPEWKRDRRYRFPTAKAFAIANTAATFYADGGSVSAFLERYQDPFSARRQLVEKAKGIGPKQASMVLRNVGASDDLAILDAHLLRFLSLCGLCQAKVPSVSSLNGYEKTEEIFFEYSNQSGWPAGILDQAIWVVMRVYQREAQWAL